MQVYTFTTLLTLSEDACWQFSATVAHFEIAVEPSIDRPLTLFMVVRSVFFLLKERTLEIHFKIRNS